MLSSNYVSVQQHLACSSETTLYNIVIACCYTGQKKVALLDVETHDNPIPLESYTMTQGKVWAVICQPGKLFIIINLKECDN